MGRIHKFFLARIYNKKTNYLLNYLTLQIKDKEIAKQYDQANADHFNRLFPPTFVVKLLYFIHHVILKLTTDIDYTELVSATFMITIMLFWALIKWKFPLHTPKLNMIYSLSMLIYVNLQYRDQLPGFMSSDDLLQTEDKIFSTMVVSYSFNYNSYLTTTI